jgi:hypothetical protein
MSAREPAAGSRIAAFWEGLAVLEQSLVEAGVREPGPLSEQPVTPKLRLLEGDDQPEEDWLEMFARREAELEAELGREPNGFERLTLANECSRAIEKRERRERLELRAV